LAGGTSSTTAIATTGAHQTANGGEFDAFLVKFEGLNTSLNENIIQQTIKLYPNPSNGLFIVESKLIGKSYSITDLNGKVVEEGIINNTLMEINLNSESSGVYFFRIENQVMKLMKQ